MSPEENFKFVNSYLNNIGPLIRKNNGYIDKFMGDGVMALFKTSEKDAIIAAIEMHKSLNSYNQKSSINGQDPIKIGIGINTGKMMLGTLGESNRMEGSVISDAVNIASRLESLTKVYKSDILISVDIKKKIKQKDLFTRFVDIVKVKGKSDSFSIYEVIDSNSIKSYQLKKDTIKDFKKGIELYQSKKFKNALKLFNKIFDINPNDYINFLYKSRCENLIKKTNLIKNWSPIVEYSEK
jgi:two-component system sensor histidine kinase ChiS